MDNDNVCCQQNHDLTRPTEQDRADLPHSGRGGAWEVWNRQIEITRAQAGLETTAHRTRKAVGPRLPILKKRILHYPYLFFTIPTHLSRK